MMTTTTDLHLMEQALALGTAAKENGNEPFGAILVKDSHVVKLGRNQIHTETDPTNHAELGLIRDFCRETGLMDLSDYTLYTSCEPCCMCAGAMVWAKLGKLRYSVSHDQLAEIAGANIMLSSADVFAKSPHAPEVHGGLLQAAGLELLKSYAWD